MGEAGNPVKMQILIALRGEGLRVSISKKLPEAAALLPTLPVTRVPATGEKLRAVTWGLGHISAFHSSVGC